MAKPRRFAPQSAAERAARVEALNTKLTAAVQELTHSDQWMAMPRTSAAFHDYSPRNVLLLWMQAQERGIDLTHVAGFTTWRKLGRSVRAGERGFAVLAPVTRRVADDERSADEPAQTGKRKMIGVRVAHVFDIAQTVGQPLPEPPRPAVLSGPDAAGLWEPLARLVAEHGYELERLSEQGEAPGWTDHRERVVSVRHDLDGAQATAILAHGLAHIRADHEHRALSQAQRETEAESAAHVVLSACGVATAALAVPYVAGWSRGDAKVISDAAETVHKVATGLLADIQRLTDPAPKAGPAPVPWRARHAGIGQRAPPPRPRRPVPPRLRRRERLSTAECRNLRRPDPAG